MKPTLDARAIRSKDAQGSPKHVAVVAYSDYVHDMRIMNEAEALADAGFLVDVVSMRPENGGSSYHYSGITLHEVPLEIRRGGRVRYLYQYSMFFALSSAILLRLQIKYKFDFAHVHTLPDFQVFCTLPIKLIGGIVVLDLHEAMPEMLEARFQVKPGSLQHRLAVFAEVLSCRFADRLIAASEGIRDTICQNGIRPSRFAVVYNSGDREVLGQPPETLREILALPTQRLLVHAGSVNPERDLKTLIRALDMLAMPDLDIVIAGSGEPSYIESLRLLARELGLGDRIHFTGNLPIGDARALMSLSELGVVTLERNALTEFAWPVRIIEFANMKKHLVVPDVRFIRHVLGTSAEYYEPNDPVSLARAIRAALSESKMQSVRNPEPWQICAQFGWDRMRPVLVSVFDSPS